ncbi:MAG: PEP-CTERM sorting domain-containing protein [Betaproteobacteria bacterium]|nr:PEP-CTERM sorting domain-containing protein [Betaproteobacteria bacterium]
MLKKVLVAAAVAGSLASGHASAYFLTNWSLNPYGTGFNNQRTSVAEFLDLVGPSYVSTTTPAAGNFSFNEVGAVQITGADGSGRLVDQSGLISSNFNLTGEVTAVFDLTGAGTLGGSVAYTAGSINVYAQAGSQDFGTVTAGSMYGANNGILIGTFSPVTGGGNIDPTGIPNGQQTISAQATFLAAGYFFDSLGNDLSANVGGNLFGFATTNASRVVNPTTTVLTEVVGESPSINAGMQLPFTNCLPGEVAGAVPGSPCTGADGTGRFVISNNGQFRLTTPEPAGIALTGLALFAAGAFARRRSRKA